MLFQRRRQNCSDAKASANKSNASACRRTCETVEAGPNQATLKDMLSDLSERELEVAARSSYGYAKDADELSAKRRLARGMTTSDDDDDDVSSFADEDEEVDRVPESEDDAATDMDSDRVKASRERAAMQMAGRHLIATKGETRLAVKKFRRTVQYRQQRRLEDIRKCFQDTDDALDCGVSLASSSGSSSDTDQTETTSTFFGGDSSSIFAARVQASARRMVRTDLRRKITKYCGSSSSGRLFVRGYDKHNRAFLHIIVRNSPEHSKTGDFEGCVESHQYMLERALACTERRSSGQEQSVNVSVDFAGFQKWHVPMDSTMQDILQMCSEHYPERLNKVYMVDAPWSFRVMWSVFKPFVDPITREKFVFVTGRRQKVAAFSAAVDRSQAMPYQLPTGSMKGSVDMNRFFELPFDHAYDEEGC